MAPKNDKIETVFKLRVAAGAANPAPPVGPALGQRGINIAGFCAQFNEITKDMEKGAPVSALITVYKDKKFAIAVKTSPASHFLRKAAKLKKGGATPGRDVAGSVTRKQCRDIAELKMVDLSAVDLDAATKIIEGSARSMGLEVVD